MLDLNHSTLHHHVMERIVLEGIAPTVKDIATTFGVSSSESLRALKSLEDYHGVVLHPKSSEIWVMHPFSLAPTNFWIQSERGSWWGNCAWCSLGAAALLGGDLTITTTLGGESKQVVVEVRKGEVTNKDLHIHFPVPMRKAWDNVIYTCSTMLMFESESDVDDWCERHGLPRGDIQPIQRIWEFSKVWYGNHLDPHWVKWSVDEAKDIFRRFGLTHAVWDVPSGRASF